MTHGVVASKSPLGIYVLVGLWFVGLMILVYRFIRWITKRMDREH